MVSLLKSETQGFPYNLKQVDRKASRHRNDVSADGGSQSARKPSQKRSAPSSKTTKPRKKAKAEDDDNDAPKKSNGLTKPVLVSDELAEFLGGQKEISRPQMTKAFWNYFKVSPTLVSFLNQALLLVPSSLRNHLLFKKRSSQGLLRYMFVRSVHMIFGACPTT